MDSENPSIISHVSIGVKDFARATAFYDAVFKAIGARRIMDFPGAVAYGRAFPEFWVQTPIDGKASSSGNGTHFAFDVGSKERVDAFYRAALAAGATDEGEPGGREEYSEAYYGCFVRDPDGHKIEATHWDATKAPPAHQH
jgi:catechol 2,3-dioxygenase-like lactoylglutathione lyase family enzyme